MTAALMDRGSGSSNWPRRSECVESFAWRRRKRKRHPRALTEAVAVASTGVEAATTSIISADGRVQPRGRTRRGGGGRGHLDRASSRFGFGFGFGFLGRFLGPRGRRGPEAFSPALVAAAASAPLVRLVLLSTSPAARGQGAAMDKSLHAARGDLLALMESDDTRPCDTLAQLVGRFGAGEGSGGDDGDGDSDRHTSGASGGGGRGFRRGEERRVATSRPGSAFVAGALRTCGGRTQCAPKFTSSRRRRRRRRPTRAG